MIPYSYYAISLISEFLGLLFIFYMIWKTDDNRKAKAGNSPERPYTNSKPFNPLGEPLPPKPISKPYQFPLRNVAMYAKNNYKRTDNIWNDLVLLLAADDYSGWEPRYKQDIALLIFNKTMKLLPNEYRMEEFLRHISPQESWKVGFYTKGNSPLIRKTLNSEKEQQQLPEYDYWEAVVRACLSELSRRSAPELGYEDWSLFSKTAVPELIKEKNQPA